VENGKNTEFVGENGNCNGKIILNDDGIETEKPVQKLENQRQIRFNFCPFSNAYTAGIYWLADSGLTTQHPVGRHTARHSDTVQ